MSSGPKQFYHGTRADLKPGDLIVVGYTSNFGTGKPMSWVYLTATLDAEPSSTAYDAAACTCPAPSN